MKYDRVLRKCEYYIKNMTPYQQKTILAKFTKSFSLSDRDVICDEPNNYENIKKSIIYKYKPDALSRFLEKYEKTFSDMNEIMISGERKPFFDDPKKLYESLMKFDELNEYKTEEEWEKIFGCSYDEYKPEKYKPIASKQKGE